MKTLIRKPRMAGICIRLFALYVICAGVFYYAAGAQLYERRSANEISSVPGETVTPELVDGFGLCQQFDCEMDQVRQFSVRIATYARRNTGSLSIGLWDHTAGHMLYSQDFLLEELDDGQELECILTQPASGVRGHVLSIRVCSPQAVSGNAAALWYASETNAAGSRLSFRNGEKNEAKDGSICFSVQGLDHVWTGPHYWEIVLAAGVVLCLLFVWLVWKKRMGKQSILFTAAELAGKYRFLVRQLVSRDFKIKYRRSALGALWSFVNPLMTMCVQYIVFSTIFKMDIYNYPVYLLSGIVLFNFFTESTNAALNAITGNAGLITKVYVPKVIYPVSKVLSTGVNLLISLLPLLLMSLATGIRMTRAWLLLPYGILCLLVFCIGVGLMLSAVMVFFRDMQFIWSVLCMVWNYITPVFYPESILSEPMQAALGWNPMYQYILFFRSIILDGISPEPRMYLKCFACSMMFLLTGYALFQKLQDRFIFHI